MRLNSARPWGFTADEGVNDKADWADVVEDLVDFDECCHWRVRLALETFKVVAFEAIHDDLDFLVLLIKLWDKNATFIERTMGDEQIMRILKSL